jgi:hypothetical protein
MDGHHLEITLKHRASRYSDSVRWGAKDRKNVVDKSDDEADSRVDKPPHQRHWLLVREIHVAEAEK